ncbi:MAG: Stp1/IreP family PP2C-type Ser/Thr phosphatase [Acidimicrobiia bacterium]|nr:Stp1/IreP family PP2C-type Ser/Thr phosphatase [Acidimicrobiia bacterium]
MALRGAAATDVGRVRSVNQDGALLAEHLYVVADGMGGHRGGEVASSLALQTLQVASAAGPFGSIDELVDAIDVANRTVFDGSRRDPELRGMGTTLCGLALVRDGALIVVNVGDSRAYRLRERTFTQLTVDHSLVQLMVDEGQISPDEADSHPHRNILTRALGIEEDVTVDIFPEQALAGDRYLVCSDGLFNELSDYTIATTLVDEPDGQLAAQRLVEMANEHGGRDNITCLVVDALDVDGADGAVAAPSSQALLGSGPRVADDADDPELTTLVRPPVAPDRGAGPERGAGAGGNGGAASAVRPRVRTATRPARREMTLTLPDPAAAAASPAPAVLPVAAAPGGATPAAAGSPSDDLTELLGSETDARTGRAAPDGEPVPAGDTELDAAIGLAGVSDEIEIPRHRYLTARTAAFLASVVLVLAVGAGAVSWFVNRTYFVTIDGDEVVIARGPREPLLWIESRVDQRTGLSAASLTAPLCKRVLAEPDFSDRSEAEAFVEQVETDLAQARVEAPLRTGAQADTTPSTVCAAEG